VKPKHCYLALSFLGLIVPLVPFVPWLVEHGFDVPLLVRELFANRISAFFGLDVIVSAIVVGVFASVERGRRTLRIWWAPILGVFCAGVSFGLPLLLFMRERELSGRV
jgi:uncharacterized protein DUF2834